MRKVKQENTTVFKLALFSSVPRTKTNIEDQYRKSKSVKRQENVLKTDKEKHGGKKLNTKINKRLFQYLCQGFIYKNVKEEL